MDLRDINFESLHKLERKIHSDTYELFYNDDYYFKIIPEFSLYYKTSLAYYTLDGLDHIWMGDDQLAVQKVGLIDEKLIPAFRDYIYADKVCIGYSTYKGTHLKNLEDTDNLKLKYLTYLSKLAEHSIKCGWGYVSLGTNNIVEYNGQLSFIDLDFSPIKLRHNKIFNDREKSMWENEFRCGDGFYLKMIKGKL